MITTLRFSCPGDARAGFLALLTAGFLVSETPLAKVPADQQPTNVKVMHVPDELSDVMDIAAVVDTGVEVIG